MTLIQFYGYFKLFTGFDLKLGKEYETWLEISGDHHFAPIFRY